VKAVRLMAEAGRSTCLLRPHHCQRFDVGMFWDGYARLASRPRNCPDLGCYLSGRGRKAANPRACRGMKFRRWWSAWRRM
jgi:hypothetical protein